MNTNPFLTSGISSNTFSSNLYSNNRSNDPFKLNNNTNNLNQTGSFNYNPFKTNNNTNFNTSSNNNNDIFSRIKSNITDNTNNNMFNSNNTNPFLTNNNTNMFNNNNNNTFNNNNLNTYSFGNQNNQNLHLYNFNGISTRLPICQTVGKTPITTFNNNINYKKEYTEKNKLNGVEYNNVRSDYICNDENLKNFSMEEIRWNDYVNAKIPYFDKWSQNDYIFDNQTNNFLNNNNNNGSNNTYSIFNQNNRDTFLSNGNNNGNPFINNGNNNNLNNNPFNNNNNATNNPFLNNNIGNNNKTSFLGINNNFFNNNTNNNPFNNTGNKNAFNSNIFNNNNNGNGISFGTNLNNNNIFNNPSSNNIFNNNNNNNIFNRNNNIFNNNNLINTNNNNNIFNNNNNNNIFNNPIHNPFNSILKNTNNNNNNIINNNISVNNIFNNNINNFLEKPFEEKVKDPTWVKRNVKIVKNKDLDDWASDYINDITQTNLKVKEMQYFDFKEENNKFNLNEYETEEISPPQNLIFNKILLSTDEEIFNYNKTKKEKEKEKINIVKENYNNGNISEQNNYNYQMKNKFDPIFIQNNRNQNLENNYTKGKINISNYETKKPNMSGFAEASQILSNLDNNFVEFNTNIREPKEYILPTEKPDFYKFNNIISNKQSIISPYDSNENNGYNNGDNNINFELNNNNYNNNIEPYLMNNEFNEQNNDFNVVENKESIRKDDLSKNNLINTNSNKTTKINSDEVNRNIIITDDNLNNENIINNNNFENECKLIFSGQSTNIPELTTPIIIPFSSIILNPENILNFDLILDIITKNILSIDDIENKIVIPKKEDIFLNIDGKIYSKLTNTIIDITQVEKNYDQNKNFYYYISYNFKIKQYPLLLNDLDNLDNKYITKPTIEELLNPDNNYNLKNVENFEIWNKYGKVIFMDPIDLSGKIVINDIIKIEEGEIDLAHERVDKLKARAFLYYDFGDKLEGTYLENIKSFLQKYNGTFVKYENKIFEYTINY